MHRNKIILFVITFALLSGCASQKAQYRTDETAIVSLPTNEINRTFYLVGDAGKSPMNGLSKGLSIFQKHISQRDTKKDYTLFLGDNIYPSGLPKPDEEGRKEAENALNAQIKSVESFEGQTLFIPGNHDWYSDGLKGLKLEEEYIEAALGKDTYKPENGCPIESIEIDESIQLIIVDTQWYLENWNKHPTVNDECPIKTRKRFLEELEGELKKAQGKRVVFAMHHPMYTNGIHGGFYSAKKHLYPTQANFPLPILASLLTQVRTQGGVSIQDRYNERYNELMKRIETIALEYDNIVFASGHEHTLQYIENNGIKQIVSGSGAKEAGVALSSNGLFATGEQGFADLSIYKDGSIWVSFYGDKNGEPNLLFRKEILTKTRDVFNTDSLATSFPATIETSIYSKEETDKSDFYEVLLGDRYRDLYSTKIKVPVATLDTLYGGLEIMRSGGGHQTRSLRLRMKDGRELNMRALRKSATQYLQSVLFKNTHVDDDFDKTYVEDLILDFYTAAHPYAFFVVPDLSNAAKVYHTNPRLYYIPKHSYLGDYNTEYGDELYMIEERPEENYSDERNFGYADDLESTHDIISKIREDEKYKIDEVAYIRARLFDMLLGDWDRHQDQWRWAQFDQENGDKLFKPIPRDRDQVFSNFDGALLNVMRAISGSTKQLQVYDAELADLKWMNSAGIKLDKVLIQQAEKDVWLEQAEFLKNNISDQIIATAFSKIPSEVQDESLIDIQQNLKGRRENLIDIADRYYNYLNELVILTGTDKDDLIQITRLEKNNTHVKISRIIDDEEGEVLLDKTFSAEITKELWIYGLDDKDIFEVSGKADNPIYIRIIGGQDHDIFRIKSGRRVRVYDHKSKPNTIEENKGAKIDFADTYTNNLFDFNKNIVKTGGITPNFGYNPDDGFLIGISKTSTINGFHRNPFSTQHQINGNYAFATNGISLGYIGEFANMFGDWNLKVAGKFNSQNFTRNFFGYGNETENPDDALGLNYNRVKKGLFSVNAGLLKRGDFGSDFSFNLMLEGIKIGETQDRFIDSFNQTAFDPEFFERRYFASLNGNFNYLSIDSKTNPTRGMTFNTDAGIKVEPSQTQNTFAYLNSSMGFYNALISSRKLVLKTDVRSQFRFGDNLLFYQASSIGAVNGLRGYRNERFTGQSSLIGSSDLRYTFSSIKTKTVPLQIGLFIGGDIGRVWLKNSPSDKWHNDYGGGFWITAAESIRSTFNLFNGADGLRFSFGFGLDF